MLSARSLVVLFVSPLLAQGPAPTTSFGAATPVLADGKPLMVDGHAAVRCFDWDGDGDLDLLIGGGDGRIWSCENRAPRGTAAEFGAPLAVVAEGRERWGTSYTGAVLHDFDRDGLPDLWVAHSDRLVSLHKNVGTQQAPAFDAATLELTVQAGCQGRFDVADWDRDGKPDVVVGGFDGAVVWHQNLGTPTAPKFGPQGDVGGIRTAYNVHPRVLDFDRDGRLDLLTGINWGTVSLYPNVGKPTPQSLGAPSELRSAVDGKPLNLREQNSDDTTPELADLDADGTLDLLSGGKNGRIWWLHGVGAAQRVSTFRDALSQDRGDRDAAFGALGGLQADLAAGLVSPAQREDLAAMLAILADVYPSLLRRRAFDLAKEPFAPMLAAQFWVVVKAMHDDTPAGRARVADVLGFQGGYRDLLVDLGVIFYDNNKATPRQLVLMHRLLSAMPRATWDVELISVADWLGEGRNRYQVRARTAVNIFGMNLGVPENSFAGDSPRPGVTDVFMICLAHEIAHNMLDTVGRRRRPELFERKFEGLAFGAGPDVAYRSPRSDGIDYAATKRRFAASGAWDGDDASWNVAWRDYFEAGPRKDAFDKAYARGNVRFFLESPQEAFSTLANQYFADSELMLEFAKARWDAGHRSTVHQFLLIADYLADGGDDAPTYQLPRGGDLKVGKARVRRDERGRLIAFATDRWQATFDYEPSEGTPTSAIVSRFDVTPR
ncbi:MAG: hypothetical protein RL398_217 [Planctomycetota bacterium]|jgi:hypothetical protein